MGKREWKRQDYAVRLSVMSEVLREMNLRFPDRDLFADSSNARCAKFLDVGDDAMAMSWSNDFGWCNPPFSLMPQVVEKILRERPEILVVVPDWQRLTWFAKLREAADKQAFRPCGVRIFELAGKAVGPTRWGTWFFYLAKRESKEGPSKAVSDAKVRAVNAQHNLRIPIRMMGESGARYYRALVDTGAEVCLVRRGVISPHEFRTPIRPIVLKTASDQVMGGGQREALVVFEMMAQNEETGRKSLIRIPTWCYEADIKEDIILSYSWCWSRGMDIVATDHGLRCRRDGRSYWVAGADDIEGQTRIGAVTSIAAERDMGKWALSIFAGNGGPREVLRARGFQVLTVDPDSSTGSDVGVDPEDWDFLSFPRDSFEEVIVQLLTPSGQESRMRRRLERVIDILRYFQPRIWALQLPRGSELLDHPSLQEFPYVDIDLCQFGRPNRRELRFWGIQTTNIPHCVCNPRTCGSARHPRLRYRRDQASSWVPEDVYHYVLSKPLEQVPLIPVSIGQVQFEEDFQKIYAAVKGKVDLEKPIQMRSPKEHPMVDQYRAQLLERFGNTSMSGKYVPNPPIRGPFGAGRIHLMEGAIPVSRPSFRIGGERGVAHKRLVEEVIAAGKVEPGSGPWNLPSFLVPKKTPGQYRLVQDFRPLNEVTQKDGHPLPRISDILQRQAEFRLWSKFDLVDGYHQMPILESDRPYTCMSTPCGTMQWKVLSMGLKNAGSQFQHMIEWVLQEIDCASPYIDDVLVGSRGETWEECIANHFRDVSRVLQRFEEVTLVCHPKKSFLFHTEVEFCGHILSEGTRKPSPGKLLPIQNWQLPRTITELRGFLGLTNHFSEYVRDYAKWAGPLTEKLKVGREEGRKGSKKPVQWDEASESAFRELKQHVCEGLLLFQPDPSQPFLLYTDASDFAIGAVLRQRREGKEVPVAFFSRKLVGSQLNWTPWEKEMYAVVAALWKWAGVINFQPVTVMTDHQALRHWVTENVETPSGPRGRRARWHQTLSEYDLTIQYLPGPNNQVADALSRWAYPAGGGRDDATRHGTVETFLQVQEMLEDEARERATLVRCVDAAPSPTLPPCHEFGCERRDGHDHALDLFSGTRSVANVLGEMGFEVTTVDNDPKFMADIRESVLTWDFRQYPPGFFKLVAASPPCTEFSRAKTVGVRRLGEAMGIVVKTLEIIQYLQPEVWWLETPRYGLLPRQPEMQGIAFVDVDYCRFGEGGFQKPTRIFGCERLRSLTPQLCLRTACPTVREGKHIFSLGGVRNASPLKTFPLPPLLVQWLVTQTLETCLYPRDCPRSPRGDRGAEDRLGTPPRGGEAPEGGSDPPRAGGSRAPAPGRGGAPREGGGAEEEAGGALPQGCGGGNAASGVARAGGAWEEAAAGGREEAERGRRSPLARLGSHPGAARQGQGQGSRQGAAGQGSRQGAAGQGSRQGAAGQGATEPGVRRRPVRQGGESPSVGRSDQRSRVDIPAAHADKPPVHPIQPTQSPASPSPRRRYASRPHDPAERPRDPARRPCEPPAHPREPPAHGREPAARPREPPARTRGPPSGGAIGPAATLSSLPETLGLDFVEKDGVFGLLDGSSSEEVKSGELGSEGRTDIESSYARPQSPRIPPQHPPTSPTSRRDGPHLDTQWERAAAGKDHRISRTEVGSLGAGYTYDALAGNRPDHPFATLEREDGDFSITLERGAPNPGCGRRRDARDALDGQHTAGAVTTSTPPVEQGRCQPCLNDGGQADSEVHYHKILGLTAETESDGEGWASGEGEAHEIRPEPPHRPSFRFLKTNPLQRRFGVQGEDLQKVLAQDWSVDYQTSEHWAETWKVIQSESGDWPTNVLVWQHKIFVEGKLAVPERLSAWVVMAQHSRLGHCGKRRLMMELRRRYVFAPSFGVEAEVSRLKSECRICQLCDPENFTLEVPIQMTPIIDQFFGSVCLDIFQMPPEKIGESGEECDCFVLCVDRLTGWMIARPTQLSGLTGEKAAKLLVDSCWGEIGVPAVITSDQDTRFVSAFFLTVCTMLGIRNAFSHAHRPQANGRAEVAGRVVKDLVRKICLEQGKSWLEVLPQVLRIKHDMVDPETGFSPYQLVFGRERPGVGLPWGVERVAEDAREWVLRHEKVHSEIAESVRRRLRKAAVKVNRQRRDRMFRPGDRVWVKRPAPIGGKGVEPFWWGPVVLSRQVGLDSFIVKWRRSELTFHASQIRLAVEVGEVRELRVQGTTSKVCDP